MESRQTARDREREYAAARERDLGLHHRQQQHHHHQQPQVSSGGMDLEPPIAHQLSSAADYAQAVVARGVEYAIQPPAAHSGSTLTVHEPPPSSQQQQHQQQQHVMSVRGESSIQSNLGGVSGLK